MFLSIKIIYIGFIHAYIFKIKNNKEWLAQPEDLNSNQMIH